MKFRLEIIWICMNVRNVVVSVSRNAILHDISVDSACLVKFDESRIFIFVDTERKWMNKSDEQWTL